MREKIMYFLKRLREPSTMAGLGAIAMLFGVPPGTLDLASQAVAGVLAVAAIVLPETKQ
jgi:hypothetical protein